MLKYNFIYLLMQNGPWNKLKISENGLIYTTSSFLCINKKYSSTQMKKVWNDWYNRIINPQRINAMIKKPISDLEIYDLPGIRVKEDTITSRLQEDYLNEITVRQIIGLYLINFDIDIENHKKKFIDEIQKHLSLEIINEFDEIIDGLNTWLVRKNILKINKKKNKWTHYDKHIIQLSSAKPDFDLITSSDIIKIQLLGSGLYDNLISFDKYLYFIISNIHPDRNSVVEKYIIWLNSKK